MLSFRFVIFMSLACLSVVIWRWRLSVPSVRAPGLIHLLIPALHKSFACFLNLLTFFLTYLLISLRIGPLHFHAGGRKRRPSLALLVPPWGHKYGWVMKSLLFSITISVYVRNGSGTIVTIVLGNQYELVNDSIQSQSISQSFICIRQSLIQNG